MTPATTNPSRRNAVACTSRPRWTGERISIWLAVTTWGSEACRTKLVAECGNAAASLAQANRENVARVGMSARVHR